MARFRLLEGSQLLASVAVLVGVDLRVLFPWTGDAAALVHGCVVDPVLMHHVHVRGRAEALVHLVVVVVVVLLPRGLEVFGEETSAANVDLVIDSFGLTIAIVPVLH